MRDVDALSSEIAWRCRALLMVSERILGIPLLVVHTTRTIAEQMELYAKGRTTKGEPPYTAEKPLGRTVTNARGGSSWHNHGRAFDVVPLDAEGKPDWNASPIVWEAIGKLGEALGLEWGGRPGVAVAGDYGHFQLRPEGYARAIDYSRSLGMVPPVAGVAP